MVPSSCTLTVAGPVVAVSMAHPPRVSAVPAQPAPSSEPNGAVTGTDAGRQPSESGTRAALTVLAHTVWLPGPTTRSAEKPWFGPAVG